MISVLFVCTGNICRSPTAEGVFRHLVSEAGLEKEFRIASAGTEGFHKGDVPDHRAVKIAQKYGVAIGHQRSRPVTDEDFDGFDYIFAMDNGHYEILRERAPGNPRAKIAMFLQRGDVPDPYNGSEKDFERVYALVKDGAAVLLQKIREENKI